jgi:hypothetical protein
MCGEIVWIVNGETTREEGEGRREEREGVMGQGTGLRDFAV